MFFDEFFNPTLAFKDVGLAVTRSVIRLFLEKKNGQNQIIGATSGDTGSAAIEARKGRKISLLPFFTPRAHFRIQRRQMTRSLQIMSSNSAVEGTFDDCQNLVKQAFPINLYERAKNLSAINSNQLGAYYFPKCITLMRRQRVKYPISVPTENFGNIYAAWVAKQMGQY